MVECEKVASGQLFSLLNDACLLDLLQFWNQLLWKCMCVCVCELSAHLYRCVHRPLCACVRGVAAAGWLCFSAVGSQTQWSNMQHLSAGENWKADLGHESHLARRVLALRLGSRDTGIVLSADLRATRSFQPGRFWATLFSRHNYGLTELQLFLSRLYLQVVFLS